MPPSAPDVARPGGLTHRPTGPVIAAFAGAGVAGVVLSAWVASGEQVLGARWALLARLAGWAVAWAIGVAAALRMPRRIAVPAVFAVAIALRLAALAGPPTLSDDLYRYSWDARVQLSGTDPYRYSPEAREVAGLKEEWLWPDAEGCAALHRPEGCTRINRPSVRTIYPPAAEAWFTAVYQVGGIDARHKLWQVAGLLGDVTLVGILPLALRAWRRDERWTALYALSPVPVLEVVNNGHVDGLAALFVVLALLAVARRRPAWAGACLGVAVAVKLYPALLVLGVAMALWRRRRADAGRVVAVAGGVVGLAYLPHVAAVGLRVLGYLPGYLREEKYGEGGRYLLAGVLGLPAGVTAVLAAAGFAAVAAWALRRRPDAPRACAALLGGLLLAVTPVQPWYAVTLLAVAVVAGRPAWSAVAVAGYPYFFAVILDHPHAVAIGRISYGLAIVVVVLGSRISSPATLQESNDVVGATEGRSPGGSG